MTTSERGDESLIIVMSKEAEPGDVEHVVERLRDIVMDARDVLDQGEAAIGLDIKFHITIAELSDSRFLIETLEMLRPHWHFVGNFVRSLGVFGSRTGKRMTAEHLRVVDAITKGDEAAARQIMTEPINESERRVVKGL